jgi:hypothetical protein
VSPVKYDLGFYIPKDGILRSHRCGNLKSYIISEFFMSEMSLQITLTNNYRLFQRKVLHFSDIFLELHATSNVKQDIPVWRETCMPTSLV